MRDLMKLTVVAVGCAAFTITAAPAQDFSPAGNTLAEVSRQAWKMAAEGKFDEAVDAIRQVPEDPNRDPQYASLLKHIESHEARKSDEGDLHARAVGTRGNALKAAYESGRLCGKGQ